MSATDQQQKAEDDLSTMERFTDLISDIITTVSEHKSDLLEETSSITTCIDKIAGKSQKLCLYWSMGRVKIYLYNSFFCSNVHKRNSWINLFMDIIRL